MKVKSFRRDTAEDLSRMWSAEKIAKVEVGRYCQVNFQEDGTSEMYKSFGKEQVDEMVRKLEQGKKARQEHALDGDKVLLVVQSIPMKYGVAGGVTSAVTFFDNGSTCFVVRNQFSRQQILYGKEIMILLTTVNGTTNLTTKLYLVELVEKEGQKKVVKAFGLDSIAGKLPSVNYGELKKKFSLAIQEVWTSLTSRPSRLVVDLLVGIESISLHPVCLKTREDMVARWSRFGVGYVLKGTIPKLMTSNCLQFGETAAAIRVERTSPV